MHALESFQKLEACSGRVPRVGRRRINNLRVSLDVVRRSVHEDPIALLLRIFSSFREQHHYALKNLNLLVMLRASIRGSSIKNGDAVPSL